MISGVAYQPQVVPKHFILKLCTSSSLAAQGKCRKPQNHHRFLSHSRTSSYPVMTNNHDETPIKPPADLWIFGYGSLIWKNADVPHTEARICHVRGYKRRAWQGSTDHRGTVDAPGRVVSIYSKADFKLMNIIEKDENETPQCAHDRWVVHGMAFKVTDEHREKVISSLNIREIDGYEPVWLPLHVDEDTATSSEPFVESALTYVAPPNNPRFLGFAPHHQIASYVTTKRGLSGPNIEYIKNLHDSLCRIGHPDYHISSIVEMACST